MIHNTKIFQNLSPHHAGTGIGKFVATAPPADYKLLSIIVTDDAKSVLSADMSTLKGPTSYHWQRDGFHHSYNVLSTIVKSYTRRCNT